jgi:hypothetical protein
MNGETVIMISLLFTQLLFLLLRFMPSAGLHLLCIVLPSSLPRPYQAWRSPALLFTLVLLPVHLTWVQTSNGFVRAADLFSYRNRNIINAQKKATCNGTVLKQFIQI